MKKLTFIVALILFSCKEAKKDNLIELNSEQKSKSILKTNKLIIKDCVVDNNLYSSLDYISWGDTWVNKSLKKEYVYRIIVSSVGEEVYLYSELFEIKEDGPNQFINRLKVNSKGIGLEYFSSIPEFKWDSYSSINLSLNDKNYNLKLMFDSF